LSETRDIPVGVVRERGRGGKGGQKGETSAATVTRITAHPRCYYYAQLRVGSASGWRKEAGGRCTIDSTKRAHTAERSVGGVNKDDEDEDVGKDNVGSRRLVAVVEATGDSGGGGAGGSGGQSTSRRGCREKGGGD